MSKTPLGLLAGTGCGAGSEQPSRLFPKTGWGSSRRTPKEFELTAFPSGVELLVLRRRAMNATVHVALQRAAEGRPAENAPEQILALKQEGLDSVPFDCECTAVAFEAVPSLYDSPRVFSSSPC